MTVIDSLKELDRRRPV